MKQLPGSGLIVPTHLKTAKNVEQETEAWDPSEMKKVRRAGAFFKEKKLGVFLWCQDCARRFADDDGAKNVGIPHMVRALVKFSTTTGGIVCPCKTRRSA